MEKIKIINGVIIVSLIVLIIFLLWFMFGNSPTLEQIMILFFLTLGGALFGVYEKLNNKIERNVTMIYQTREVLRKELGGIKLSLAKIEGKLSKK